MRRLFLIISSFLLISCGAKKELIKPAFSVTKIERDTVYISDQSKIRQLRKEVKRLEKLNALLKIKCAINDTRLSEEAPSNP